jgi:hypothetical protein
MRRVCLYVDLGGVIHPSVEIDLGMTIYAYSVIRIKYLVRDLEGDTLLLK